MHSGYGLVSNELKNGCGSWMTWANDRKTEFRTEEQNNSENK